MPESSITNLQLNLANGRHKLKQKREPQNESWLPRLVLIERGFTKTLNIFHYVVFRVLLFRLSGKLLRYFMPVSYYLMILVTKILPVKQFVAVVVFKIMSAIDQQLVTNIPLQFVKDKYYKLFLQVKKLCQNYH